MKRILVVLLAVILLAGCGAQTREPQNGSVAPSEAVNPVASGDVQTSTAGNENEQASPQPATSEEDVDNVLEKISVVAKPTLDGTFCVFITNGSESIIDELDIQIHYKDAQGSIIDMDEDGHDMVLPGYTVVSRMDAPDSYVDFDTDVSIELGVNPRYENHSEQVSISANQGDDCVIIQITNNSDVNIEEIEYAVVLYKGDDIVEVCYPQDVCDVGAGKTVVEKESTYRADYDRFEVYLNQAHTFGL